LAQVEAMWELIQNNKRKSIIIFIGMGITLLMLGYAIGAAMVPREGGSIGVVIALVIWILLSLVSYYSGDSILLSTSGAKEVNHDLHPQLFNIVEEMRLAANLPATPKVYIIDDPAPNAFATGRDPQHCAIAVTAGLLARLNRDELQGVIAHETSHIMNRDVLLVTFAGVMLGSIILLSDTFLRGLRFSSGSNRRYRSGSSSGGGGQLQAIMFLAAIILAILAPLFARIFYFAISRKREYLADASGARLTRYPQGLASALEKIASSDFHIASANRVTAPMYIINPLQAKEEGFIGLFSTHPPIEERIQILRAMSMGASFAQYLQAFTKVTGQSGAVIPASVSASSEYVPIRKPSVEEEKETDARIQTRDVGDLMRAVNNYAFIACVCGLKIKIPPNFKHETIYCPRCGAEHKVPLSQLRTAAAVLAAATAIGAKAQEPDQPVKLAANVVPLEYSRKTRGWESFSCSCGNLLQISPSFAGSHMACPVCGRKTVIKS
jgi:heat shock protein HtpX